MTDLPPPMTEPFAIRALTTRMRAERDSVLCSLKSELENLSIEIDRTLRDLHKGQAVSAHLIANAAMITEKIARWNLILDLLPFLETP